MDDSPTFFHEPFIHQDVEHPVFMHPGVYSPGFIHKDVYSPGFIPQDVDCWCAATTLAEWCNALPPETANLVSQLTDDWRVPIPDDLRDMPALYVPETWRILEEEYFIFAKTTYNAERLLNLIIHLRMEGIITGPRTKGDTNGDCMEVAEQLASWCVCGNHIPDLHKIDALYFHDTWTALERDFKIFRMKNYQTERLLNLSIHHRMHGLLR